MQSPSPLEQVATHIADNRLNGRGSSLAHMAALLASLTDSSYDTPEPPKYSHEEIKHFMKPIPKKKFRRWKGATKRSRKIR